MNLNLTCLHLLGLFSILQPRLYLQRADNAQIVNSFLCLKQYQEHMEKQNCNLMKWESTENQSGKLRESNLMPAKWTALIGIWHKVALEATQSFQYTLFLSTEFLLIQWKNYIFCLRCLSRQILLVNASTRASNSYLGTLGQVRFYNSLLRTSQSRPWVFPHRFPD